MKKTLMTTKEKRVLCGISRCPHLSDRELSSIVDVKLSTFTAIKRRLLKQGFFRPIIVPMLNNLGSELLGVTYTQFNPVIPLKERVKTTRKTVEVFDEIFFSVGEQEKGFSLNISKNYTNIGRINEIRTETFGKVGLLEKEYPNEVIFPFETSNIVHFFDYTRVLSKMFAGGDTTNIPVKKDEWFNNTKSIELSKKEKLVLSAIVKNPLATSQKIGDIVGLSRHTVSRMKKHFFKIGLLKQLILPDLYKLGFEILSLYHVKFDPHKAPSGKDIDKLDTAYTVFLGNRKFEAVLISVYPTYQEYKKDMMDKIRFLKENDLISSPPMISEYLLDRTIFIKDFNFAPITTKILLNRDK